MYTTWGLRSVCRGGTGLLAPGMLAELAVLDRNVLTIDAKELPGTRSVTTLVDGEIIHETGILAQETPK